MLKDVIDEIKPEIKHAAGRPYCIGFRTQTRKDAIRLINEIVLALDLIPDCFYSDCRNQIYDQPVNSLMSNSEGLPDGAFVTYDHQSSIKIGALIEDPKLAEILGQHPLPEYSGAVKVP